jgi:hypothetical protein
LLIALDDGHSGGDNGGQEGTHMTEEGWLTATDPGAMLEFLHAKRTDRKVRLFAVAGCRRRCQLPRDERILNALEVAEQFADGLASGETLAKAHADAVEIAWSSSPEAVVGIDASQATDPSAINVAFSGRSSSFEARVTPRREDRDARRARRSEEAREAGEVREIFGNPFRPLSLNPSWLTATVASLAQAIYEDRHLPSRLFDNQRMGILADALEEAGCDNTDILDHCRQPGEHVRGCWVVDALLGKQ